MPVTRDIRVPLRDGARLAADLHLPAGAGAWPAIVVQTPYGKEKLGAALPLASARSWLDFWDRDRFALVIADWRGYHGSLEAGGGKAVPHTAEDGADLVRWTADQPWCDRRTAAWGPSALGRAVLRTALAKPAPLRCGVPLVCAMGHRYEDFYEGGVLREAHTDAVDALGFGIADEVRAEPFSGTDFHVRGAAEDRPEDLDLPLLVVTGWFDLVVGRTLDLFSALRSRGGPVARKETRILVGPWHHTAVDQVRQGGLSFPGAAGAAARATRRFLDRWLTDVRGTASRDEPPIRYWQMGEERWLAAPEWPPPGLGAVTFHLDADGALRPDAPRAAGRREFADDPADPVPTVGGANLPIGLSVGPRDQRRIEAREDVLVFSTPALKAPVRVCGAPSVTLTAETDAVDTDLAVRLTDVHPDGRSMLVGDGIRRAKLRASTARPSPVVPWQRFEVAVDLPPTAITFPPGHRIRLLVSGTNWPRYARNAHTGADRFDAAEAAPARTSIHVGGDARSFLTLPVRE